MWSEFLASWQRLADRPISYTLTVSLMCAAAYLIGATIAGVQ